MSRSDYTKYSNKRQYNPVENQNGVETVEEPVAESTTETAPIKDAVVVDCLKLNVRAEASKDAEIIRTIDVSTELMVFEPDSTDEFYKVYLADGESGFCMRKFIKII